MRRLPVWLLAGLVPVLTVQAADKGAGQGESDEAALARTRKEIIELIGEAFCTNLVYCRILELGARPCGKPDEYLAYSNIANTDTQKLEIKALEYTFLQEEILSGQPRPAQCALPRKPRVNCVDQRCKLVP